jgi:hypothetical protein
MRPVARWATTATRGLRTHPTKLPRRRLRPGGPGATGGWVCRAHLQTRRGRRPVSPLAVKRYTHGWPSVQNKANWWAGAPPLWIGDCGLKEAGLDGVRAKRTQFGGRIVRNEPNFAPPQAAGGGNCAKRSQTWGNWGMWAEAVSLWSVARPGSKTCKTNPISSTEGRRRRVNVQNEPNLARLRTRAGGEMRETNPISKCQVACLKSQVSGRRGQTGHALTSNCTPHTSNSLGNALWRHYKRAKQSQFPDGSIRV